jgi:hypothetical protein
MVRLSSAGRRSIGSGQRRSEKEIKTSFNSLFPPTFRHKICRQEISGTGKLRYEISSVGHASVRRDALVALTCNDDKHNVMLLFERLNDRFARLETIGHDVINIIRLADPIE